MAVMLTISVNRVLTSFLCSVINYDTWLVFIHDVVYYEIVVNYFQLSIRQRQH